MKKKSVGLPGDVAAKVGKRCDAADVDFVEGRYVDAAEGYLAAWWMLPEPREQWESGREIVKCMGEAFLAAGDLENARKAILSAKAYKGSDDDESLAALVKRVNAGADRPRARAAATRKAPRRPSRRSSASTRKSARTKKK